MLKRLFVELRFLYPTDSRFNSSSPVFRLLALYSNICAILHAAACWPQALITDLQHGATNKAVQAVQIARPRCRGVKMASRPGPPRRIASNPKGSTKPPTSLQGELLQRRDLWIQVRQTHMHAASPGHSGKNASDKINTVPAEVSLRGPLWALRALV